MIPWGGISCCFSAAALYVLGRSSKRSRARKSLTLLSVLLHWVLLLTLFFVDDFANSDADHLRSLPRIDQLKDLAHLLDTACKVLPMVVTVSGRVSSDTPITCKHSGIRGVIVEEMAEQHYLKHNESNTWIQGSAVSLFNKNEVPWYLDDGTGRVYVIGARDATGFQLTLASETFEESDRTLMRGTLDYLQGLKMLGVKRIEKVLPTGTSLTVVGEAIKDRVGKVSIRRPRKGPFYVTAKPIDLLIANVGKWARLYRFASLGFSVLGVCLIAKRAIQYILERRRRSAMQKRILATVPRLDQDNKDSDEKANAPDKPAICVICLEQDYNDVFVPCGHMCCCTKCSSRLTSCPLCRGHIKQSVRVRPLRR